MTYIMLKYAHAAFAIVTISGFMLRVWWMMNSSALLQHSFTRIAPHVVDTLFLVTGIALLLQLSLNPFTQPWLLAKFGGLIAYIVLGTIAIKRGSTRQIRISAAVAAIAVFAWIVGVAATHSIASWWVLLAG